MSPHVSPLRYPGGKAALAPLLADILVENDLHDKVVVEPFAGGAGASLRLLLDEYASSLHLNDADPRIVAFWRAVLNQTDELVDRIKSTRLSMSAWHRCRAIYTAAPSRQSQIDLAFATFFLNRCNRSGILINGGPIGGYAQQGKWKLGARFHREDLIARIRRISEYRGRISVSRLDACLMLQNPPFETDKALVYLDPPYYVKGQRLYLNGLEHADHQRLADLLLDDPPFFWILTYDNADVIRKFYKSCRPRPFSLSYSAYRRELGQELLIVDPRLRVPAELLAEHHRPGRLHFCS